MYSFFWLLAIFALLLCTNDQVIAQIMMNYDLKFLSKNWSTGYSDSGDRFQQGKLITGDENAFLFASCRHLRTENNELCNVTLETLTSVQSNSKSSCFNVKIRSGNYNEFVELELYRLTNEKILIASTRLLGNKIDFQTNFNILDMNDCVITAHLTHPAKYDEDRSFLIHPIIYRDCFKIVSNSKESCKGKPNCILTYDFDGKEVSKLKSFKSDTNYLTMPVSEQSPDKGYYTYSLYKSNKTLIWNVTYFEDDLSSQSNVLMSEPIPMWPKRVAHSNAHGLYSLCWLKFVASKELQCRQFDNQSVRLNLTFELPDLTHLVVIRNLIDGGILIATGSCKGNPVFSLMDENDCNVIRIQRIAADGQKYRPLDIPNGFKSEKVSLMNFGAFEAQIIENSKDEFCFLWAWQEICLESNIMKLRYNKWCIPQKLTLIQY